MLWARGGFNETKTLIKIRIFDFENFYQTLFNINVCCMYTYYYTLYTAVLYYTLKYNQQNIIINQLRLNYSSIVTIIS